MFNNTHCYRNNSKGNLYHGIGAPSNSLGQVDDFYIDTENNLLYGPKISDGPNCYWGTYIDLRGQQGPPGYPGPQGIQGSVGPTGGSCSVTPDMIVNNITVNDSLYVTTVYTMNVGNVENFNGNDVSTSYINIAHVMDAINIDVESITVIGTINVDSLYANKATLTTLNANNVTTGSIVTNNINATSVNVTNLNANVSITVVDTHTDKIDNLTMASVASATADSLNVSNYALIQSLFADNVMATSITTAYITAGIVDATDINIKNLNVTNILNALNITTTNLNATSILTIKGPNSSINSNVVSITNLDLEGAYGIVDNFNLHSINVEQSVYADMDLTLVDNIYTGDLKIEESITTEYVTVDDTVTDYYTYPRSLLSIGIGIFSPVHGFAMSRNVGNTVIVTRNNGIRWSVDFGGNFTVLPILSGKLGNNIALSADGKRGVIGNTELIALDHVSAYTIETYPTLTFVPHNFANLVPPQYFNLVGITPNGEYIIASTLGTLSNPFTSRCVYTDYTLSSLVGYFQFDTPLTDTIPPATAIACGSETVAFTSPNYLSFNTPASILFKFDLDFTTISPVTILDGLVLADTTDEIISMAINTSGTECSTGDETHIFCLTAKNHVYYINKTNITVFETLTPSLPPGFTGKSIQVNCDLTKITVAGVDDSANVTVYMKFGLFSPWVFMYTDVRPYTVPNLQLTTTYDGIRHFYGSPVTDIEHSTDMMMYFATYGYMSYFRDIYMRTTGGPYNIGSSLNRFITVFLENNPTIVSDHDKKTDIVDNDMGLNLINKLRPVKYRLKESNNEKKFNYGLIAQDVENVVSSEFGGFVKEVHNGKTYHFLKYDQFVAPLIKANQELYKMIKEMNDKLDQLGIDEDSS